MNGKFYKYTCSDQHIDLCILRDAYHELFCFFGDFYVLGMQDAERALHSTQNARNFGWLERTILILSERNIGDHL